MGVLAATALFVFAPILSSNLNAPHLAPLLKLASGVLLFSTMNSYLTGALAGLEAYRALGRAAMITGLLYLTICSSSTWTWGITGAVAGLLGSAMLQWLILFYAVKREANLRGVEIRYRGLKDECFVFYRFSLPGALSGLTAAPALWLGQVFLVRQDGGYDELALYSAAYNLMIIVLFLPNVTNNVGMSLINNMRGQRNALQYRRVFWMNLLSTATIVVLGASMMAIGGKYALGAYGTNFYIGLPVLLLLLAASIPEALTIAMNQVLQSSERMWRALLLINLPRDLTIPVTAYLLVPSLGAVGLALACMVGRIIAFVIMGFILLQDRVHIGELEHGRRR
jgi:O-antigen/teichoic acid export membrane protein